MKKVLSIILAVVIALSSMTIVSFASDKPDFKVTKDLSGLKEDGTGFIQITLSVDANSNLTEAKFHLDYDKNFFEMMSIIAVDKYGMDTVATKETATYTCNFSESNDRLKDAADLFVAKLKVLKRGGTVSVVAEYVKYNSSWFNWSGDGNLNYTDTTNASLAGQRVTIECPHTEKVFASKVEPTCAAEGKTIDKCKECGKEIVTPIAKLPHNMKKEVVIKEATCKEVGQKGLECTVCGHKEVKSEIPKTDHIYEGHVTKHSTCTEKGTMVEKCKYCGAEGKTSELELIPHDYKTVVTKEATCAEKGEQVDRCTVCGHEINKKEIVVKHTLKTVVVKEATCEEKGSKYEECEKCDYKKENIEIPAKGHTPGDWKITKEPTKTDSGLMEKKCTVCEKTVETKEIPSLSLFKKGDVNNDKYITAVDARLVLRHVAGLVELNYAQRIAADVNGDGNITAVDARILLRVVAGLQKI